MPPVSIDETKTAGGEPARQPRPPALEPREPNHRTRAFPGAGVIPVAQRGREVGQAGRVRLFRVLRPPRRDRVLDLVPGLAQTEGRPRQARCQLRLATTVGAFSLPLGQVRLHQVQTPVERVTLPTTMRPQPPVLFGGGVEREPVRLDHRGHSNATLTGTTDNPGQHRHTLTHAHIH